MVLNLDINRHNFTSFLSANVMRSLVITMSGHELKVYIIQPMVMRSKETRRSLDLTALLSCLENETIKNHSTLYSLVLTKAYKLTASQSLAFLDQHWHLKI